MKPFASLTALVLALLAGCGGDSAPAPTPIPPAEPPSPAEPEPVRDVFYYANRCVAKPGSTPGTLRDEQQFLRLWIDETYLWYREVPPLTMDDYPTAVSYFNALKTPLLTPSGQPKDRFHFSYTDERWLELSRGVEQGYGVTWVRLGETVPRDWRIAAVEPGSAAAQADLRRGDRLLTVDGVDFVNAAGEAQVAAVNAGLFPAAAGETHRFTLERAGVALDAALASAAVTVAPVQNTRVIDTPSGRVGYLTFSSHVLPAEPQLAASVTTLRDAGVTDLVLDLRYNGGGLLSVASAMAYMIAGPAAEGRTFEQTVGNDKQKPKTPILFRTRAQTGAALPTLELKRVYVLAGPGTCSASESIINSLRGIDVDVRLIGGRTCGKPYAFYPTSNCGTTYFAIQSQGVNAKGFGDYAEGFAPTCSAPDDLEQPLGSSSEAMLAAALHHRAAGACPAPSQAARGARRGPVSVPVPVRPAASEIAIDDVH